MIKIFEDSDNGTLYYTKEFMHSMQKKNNEAIKNTLENINDLQAARDCRGASLLHLAVEYDNEEITKHLISKNFYVNLQDMRGQDALMVALKRQNFATAKVILKSKCSVSICDVFGISALQMAIAIDPMIAPYETPSKQWTEAYWQIIELILDRFDEDCASDSEMMASKLFQIGCPLSHVVFMKNSEVLRIMIEKFDSLIDARDLFTGKTALHWGVEYGKLEKVKMLLYYDANIEILDYCMNSPLMYIYTRNHQTVPKYEVELAEALLWHKATLSMAESQDVLSEMRQIFRFGSKDAIRVALETYDGLLQATSGYSLLHTLAINTNPGIYKALKGQKINVNCRNAVGDTPLATAIQFGNHEFAKFLLSEGASLKIANHCDVTPMLLPFTIGFKINSGSRKDTLTVKRRLKCLELMLEYGGDPETKFGPGDTVLDAISLHRKLLPLANYLLAHLALKQSLGVVISEFFREKISSKRQFKSYFDLCVSQLAEAKTLEISKSLSLVKFLLASETVVAIYARNKRLVTNLSKSIDHVKLETYYMNRLRRRFSKILQIAKLRKKAEDIISQNIGKLYGCNSIVTETIVEFLSNEDVQELV